MPSFASKCCIYIRIMKYRIEMQPLAGRYVVAFKDPGTGCLAKTVVLNGSAAEMLRMYLDGHDVDSIARILSERYGVGAGQIASDVSSLFKKLEIE